ncbi:hypothetical protein [Lactobacillus sp.]|uniref:hypothetical protein n=1 Tax=Lactobacillus sp. TaxID=1591 RepID=UPI0019CF4313|nr:hypothetical protein [Lactobacillus sp.]MBD5430528.1 hypothetical protein [Lactobacillus sp.]MBD5430820.1 hypothetical protein [Lactobacillus sp.]
MQVKVETQFNPSEYTHEDEPVVYVNDTAVGHLEWDADQDGGSWVFWPSDIDDGVTLYGTVEESLSEIKDRYENQ